MHITKRYIPTRTAADLLRRNQLVIFVALLFSFLVSGNSLEGQQIRRRIPPQGKPLAAAVDKQVRGTLQRLRKEFQPISGDAHATDVDVLLKAVELALAHSEFYGKKDGDKAIALLRLAEERLQALREGQAPWTEATGLVVRGYRSSIDDSVQPYGLVIPEDLSPGQPVPLYIWLHGRGDKITDLHFIHRRLTGVGTISPGNAIVLHPFGRQCIGYKSAGEIDVLEAMADVQKNYSIDSRRIVLMGFSMGGAGAWHVGAHYTDKFVAISPGAGFAETARYNRLAPEDYPAQYEQMLWGVYDVPCYTRNLFNRPVVVYSGEKDKQIQAARVMEEAYRAEGRELPHLIGPGMGHKYHPDTLRELMNRMKQAVKQGLEPHPRRVSLQTRTLRYHRMHWVTVEGLEQHWRDTRVDAEVEASGVTQIQTRNVTSLQLDLPPFAGKMLVVDGDEIALGADQRKVTLMRQQAWKLAEPPATLRKRPGLQGPIDDAFYSRFLVVRPREGVGNPKLAAWARFELEHLQDRWAALFRGKLRVKRDDEVTKQDLRESNLILWGEPESNQLLARMLSGEGQFPLPLKWERDTIQIGGIKFPANHLVPVLVYPNPLNPDRYVVINSGPTFREGHDRTNSLQNPKLPDWAVLDLSEPPNELTPGKVVAAAFFDEQWQVQ